MNKARLNLLIDIVMTVLMAAIAGLGFLIHWVLIPGKDRVAVYGRQVDLYWLGLDRHEWGDVHLVIGIALLALLVLHVALHWGLVVGIWRRMVTSGPVRVVLALTMLVLVVVLMAFPVLVTPEVTENGHGHGHGNGAGHGREVTQPQHIEPGDAEIGVDETPHEGPDGIGRGRGGSGRGRGGGGRRNR